MAAAACGGMRYRAECIVHASMDEKSLPMTATMIRGHETSEGTDLRQLSQRP